MTESREVSRMRIRLEVYRKRAVSMGWPEPREYLRNSFNFIDLRKSRVKREQVFKEKFVIRGPDFEEIHYRWLTQEDMNTERELRR